MTVTPLAVIFDLDGTLIDSAPEIAAGANAALLAEGLERLPLATIRSFIGNGVSVLFGRIAAARGLPTAGPQTARMEAAFLAAYDTAHTLTTLYPGVAAMLETLSRQGHPLAICTNKPAAPARSVLRHFGLDRHFAVVIGGDSLPVRKPDPEMLQATLERLGVREALFVGDSEVDAETAEAAGMPFALFTEGYRKTPVDQIFHAMAFANFTDLPGLIAAR